MSKETQDTLDNMDQVIQNLILVGWMLEAEEKRRAEEEKLKPHRLVAKRPLLAVGNPHLN